MTVPSASDGLQPPAFVRELAGDVDPVPVWRNGIGGITWDIGGSYIKVGPPHPEFEPSKEARRIAWLRSLELPLQIPRVLGVGRGFLLTESIDAPSAVYPQFLTDPFATARALGEALRTFHDHVPVADCPFTWGPLTGEEDLVVCHGDACTPNWLLSPAREFVGTVDLGGVGLDDRWADIAPALQSLAWNGMAGCEEHFLTGYGIPRDPEKLSRYLARWNAG
ncbi:phosphotransferase [Corynebacterium suedekumii]|nr:phosphotransferase [Corynebacterium suedekumii]